MTDVTLEIIRSAPNALSVDQVNATMLDVLMGQPVTLDVATGSQVTLELIQTASPSLEVTYGTQGPVGPAGPAGIPEDDMRYAERTDFITDSLLYRGEAVPGTNESAPGWRIRRLTIGTDDDVTTVWAEGNANFDKTWTDREALSYL